MDRRLAHLINKTVRETILFTHAPDSCVASVRLLREVLEVGFGLHLEPRAVTTLIYNRAVTGKIINQTITNADQLVAEIRSGDGWSVGIGFGAQAAVDANKWAGHLVGVTKHEDGILLWDPSLDQASRPHKNMPLAPSVWAVSHDPYGTEPVTIIEDGCLLTYKDNRERESVLALSPDWSEEGRFSQHLARALRVLSEHGAPVGDYHEG